MAKENKTTMGEISIQLFLQPSGEIALSYSLDGMTKDSAIGYLTTVMDRMRDERRYEWATCPECRQPWSAHVAIGFEEDAEDDED